MSSLLPESILNRFPLLASIGLAAVLLPSPVSHAGEKSTLTTTNNTPEVRAELEKFNPTFNLNNPVVDIIKSIENNKDYAPGHFDHKTQKWMIYIDRGHPAIAYGHRLTAPEMKAGVYTNGITDAKAISILQSDIRKKESIINGFIPSYNTLPKDVKNAILVAVYRGDLTSKHLTTKLINAGKFDLAAAEFLNNANFRTANKGIKNRMLSIAKAFYNYKPTKKI
jgi:hypothetical protein